MKMIDSLLYPIPAGIALTLLAVTSDMTVSASPDSLTTKTNIHAQSQLTKLEESKLKQNAPPPRRNPSGSSAGGRRDPITCPQDADTATTNSGLVALSPTTQSDATVAERPTFFVYVPQTSAQSAEFSLRDRRGNGIYRTTLALNNIPGLVRLSLPAHAPPLDVNRQYVWSFALICNPGDRLDDRFVTGTVQRITLDSSRLRQIQQAQPKEKVSLYQQVGLWYDAVAALYELHRTQPDDPGINKIWHEFLRSSGIDVTIDGKLSQKNLR